MPKLLLPVTHWTQARRADCVAACAKMILDYLNQPVNYDRLLRLLRIDPNFGTVARNIIYLNDPAFVSAPQTVSHGDFLLAWLEMDEYYAVIRQKK